MTQCEMNRDVSTGPTICLRGKTRAAGWGKPRIVVLTRETATDWWGYPLANPKSPVLQWPKFAWEEVNSNA